MMQFAEAVQPRSVYPVTLVLGGARSGKSRYAEQLAASSARVLFLATCTPADEEMCAKVERHRRDRRSSGLGDWTVVEEPLRLSDALRQSGGEHTVAVIDCLTLWTANLLSLEPRAGQVEIDALCSVLAAPPCAVVLVSNEVGSGIVPAFASGRAFRDLLGEINRRIASELASDVLLMVAGLPLRLKGASA